MGIIVDYIPGIFISQTDSTVVSRYKKGDIRMVAPTINSVIIVIT